MSVDPAQKDGPATTYVLEQQVGFILRQASQRHATIFGEHMSGEITPTQWAALSKLAEVGATSQNHLGRLTAMDVATIKGVVDRMIKRGFMKPSADKVDARRRLVALTRRGEQFYQSHVAEADAITDATLSPLSPAERSQLLRLLMKIV
jgi:DNA-binding MarR family transcriptional regulator